MLRITETILRNWADAIGIGDTKLAEHDYRITHLIHAIYSNEFLAQRLLLKGGSAINKFYLGELSRLSVDLDFNHSGSKEEVLEDAKEVRSSIIDTIKNHDSSYATNYDHSYEQTTVRAKYNAVAGEAVQPIKIEISHVERFPILGSLTKGLALDTGESIKVGTYSLEELLATKLRALYDRLKARDVYDLYMAYDLLKDKTALRKMFLYYFYRDRKVFTPKIFFKKLSENTYEDDVSGFIRPTVNFDLEEAKNEVIEKYDFLAKIDDNDKKFLALARYLLGEAIKKDLQKEVQSIEYPFRVLFGSYNDLDKSVVNVKTQDIKLFDKKE